MINQGSSNKSQKSQNEINHINNNQFKYIFLCY